MKVICRNCLIPMVETMSFQPNEKTDMIDIVNAQNVKEKLNILKL